MQQRFVPSAMRSTFSGLLTPRLFNAACTSLGFVGLSGPSGGLAEYFSSPASFLHRLPPNVSLKAGAMCEPLAVAIHAVKRAGFEKGMKVLVCGAGPIGVFLTVVLKAMGAE